MRPSTQHPGRLRGLPPLADGRSRVLVLGSFPSVLSLAGQRYYGHPRNQFWTILGLAADEPVPADWESRYEWALAHGLAIWDVIGECQRQGSLDQAIRDPVPNDIAGLLAQWPLIRRIVTNGMAAGRLFRSSILPTLGIPWRSEPRLFAVPSSSPIPTRRHRSALDKLPAWRPALGWPEGFRPGDRGKPG